MSKGKVINVLSILFFLIIISVLISANWIDISYDYKKNITVYHQGTTTLTNFPINLSNSGYENFVRVPYVNGSVFIYYNSAIDYFFADNLDTVKIPFRPLNYTNLTGYLPLEVFNNNYFGVWDAEDGVWANAKDFSPYGNNLLQNPTGVKLAKGVHGYAFNMTTNTRFYNASLGLNMPLNVTIEAWIKLENFTLID